MQRAQIRSVTFKAKRTTRNTHDRIDRLNDIVDAEFFGRQYQSEAAIKPTLRSHQTRTSEPLHDFRQIADRNFGALSDSFGGLSFGWIIGQKNNSAQGVLGGLGNHQGSKVLAK